MSIGSFTPGAGIKFGPKPETGIEFGPKLGISADERRHELSILALKVADALNIVPDPTPVYAQLTTEKGEL